MTQPPCQHPPQKHTLQRLESRLFESSLIRVEEHAGLAGVAVRGGGISSTTIIITPRFQHIVMVEPHAAFARRTITRTSFFTPKTNAHHRPLSLYHIQTGGKTGAVLMFSRFLLVLLRQRCIQTPSRLLNLVACVCARRGTAQPAPLKKKEQGCIGATPSQHPITQLKTQARARVFRGGNVQPAQEGGRGEHALCCPAAHQQPPFVLFLVLFLTPPISLPFAHTRTHSLIPLTRCATPRAVPLFLVVVPFFLFYYVTFTHARSHFKTAPVLSPDAQADSFNSRARCP